MSPRRWLAHLGAAAVFALLAVAAQPDLARKAATHVYLQALPGNDSLLHVWTLAWDHHAMRTLSTRPLDANIFFPHVRTLLYSDHLLGLAVLLLPLRVLTRDALLVHNLAVIAAPALNAFAVYVLVAGLVRRPGPAVVAGLAYGFAPMRFEADRAQLQMLVAWWLPLMLHWGRRALALGRRREAAAAGAALALQGLTGIYLTAFFAPFLALAHAWWLRAFPWRTHRRGWRRLLAAEALALAVVAPSAIAYRGVQADLGTVRSPVLNALLSVPFRDAGDYLPAWTFVLAAVVLLAAWRRAPAPARREWPLLLAIALGAVVLAAGPAIELPFGLGTVRGPYAALVPLPGYNALRAPGRMLHVAMVGGAALVGIALAAATATLSRPWRRLAAVAALAAVGWECAPPRFLVTPAIFPLPAPRVYDWLGTLPASTRLAELPLGFTLTHEQVWQYASIRHWKPMVNGSMGITPPVHAYLSARLARPGMREALAELSALGVTHLVVHERLMTPGRLTALSAATNGPRATVKIVRRFDDTVVYGLRPRLAVPAHAPPEPPLPRAGWRADASLDGADARLALDGDPATAWRAWGGLERRLRRSWYDPKPFLDRWHRFLAAQPARFTLDLGSVRRVSAVVVALGGSDPSAAPAIALEASRDGTTWDVLGGLLSPVPDVRALVGRAADARWSLRLAAPHEARWIRLSCDGLEWQIRELDVHGPSAPDADVGPEADAEARLAFPGPAWDTASPAPAPQPSRRP